MKRTIVMVALMALALGPAGCKRDEGPVEKAGEKIDEAVDEITHPNEGPLEEAGRKVDEAVDDTKQEFED